MTNWYRSKFTDARGRELLNTCLSTFIAVLSGFFTAIDFTWWRVVIFVIMAIIAVWAWVKYWRGRERDSELT